MPSRVKRAIEIDLQPIRSINTNVRGFLQASMYVLSLLVSAGALQDGLTGGFSCDQQLAHAR